MYPPYLKYYGEVVVIYQLVRFSTVEAIIFVVFISIIVLAVPTKSEHERSEEIINSQKIIFKLNEVDHKLENLNSKMSELELTFESKNLKPYLRT